MKGKYRGCNIEVRRCDEGFLTFAVFDRLRKKNLVNMI